MRDMFWENIGLRVTMRHRLLTLIERGDEVGAIAVRKIIRGLEFNLPKAER